MTGRVLDLGASILAAERAGRWLTPVARATAEDPFRLELPVIGTDGSADIDARTMEMLGGLYLIAQLEQTGMLRVAELLIGSRFELDITSASAAELLDRLAVEAREWYPAEARDQLYARVFGLGRASSGNAPDNREFGQLLVGFCSAVTAWGAAAHLSGPTGSARRGAVTLATRHLRTNLAVRQHGNTVAAARRIAAQVRASHELLGHPGVLALVAGSDLWDVVRAMWQGEAPDIDRHVLMGQSGQQLIGWAGSPQADTGEPTASVLEAAELWLLSTGFAREGAR
ncbi:hypothetical protein [Streptomyces sp. HUAS ZL42]|uniref:hypothetical protein n=1 Tax=Streptomyces sp. HUAS ZL42 TaxID=3231715 RepID=UPI00345EAA10